jgi:hypothetical protein
MQLVAQRLLSAYSDRFVEFLNSEKPHMGVREDERMYV